MEYRNARYSSPDNATIDMEIMHPVFGWIEFTASPDDTTDHGRSLYASARHDPATAAYVPPAEN